MPESRSYPLIDVLIIGAMKAGTSSLQYYLGQHPEICTHEQLEMTFFVTDSEYDTGYDRAFGRYFPCEASANSTILAKSAGLMYIPTALQRVRRHNSDIHLIVVLRNPVDRAYSAYWYARRRGWEDIKSFEEAIAAGPGRFRNDSLRQRSCSYLDRSMYVKHLSVVFEYFDTDQICVLLLEDLKENTHRVCQDLYEWIDVDNTFIPNTDRRNTAATARSEELARLMSSASGIKWVFRRLLPDHVVDQMKMFLRRLNEQDFSAPAMPPDTRNRLMEYFAPYNEELEEMLGRNLDHWNRNS